MSYCRFGSGDVYMYHHVAGYVECCSCRLAKKIPTIMTKGYNGLFKKCEKCQGEGCEECWCKECQGKGCDHCMMYDSQGFDTFQKAFLHLKEHVKAGHFVPAEAFERLQEDIDSGKLPSDGMEEYWSDKINENN